MTCRNARAIQMSILDIRERCRTWAGGWGGLPADVWDIAPRLASPWSRRRSLTQYRERWRRKGEVRFPLVSQSERALVIGVSDHATAARALLVGSDDRAAGACGGDAPGVEIGDPGTSTAGLSESGRGWSTGQSLRPAAGGEPEGAEPSRARCRHCHGAIGHVRAVLRHDHAADAGKRDGSGAGPRPPSVRAGHRRDI